MAREDGKRNFALREGNEETSVYSGNYPRQAALKAARRLDPAPNEDAAPRHEVRLRERGTDKIHVYDAWAWQESAPEEGPEWLEGTITEANVSKKGVERAED